MVIELLADWPPGGQVLVVGAGLCLLGLLLLPLLHGGLVSLLVVGDGLDNVLPAPGNRHVVALHLQIIIITIALLSDSLSAHLALVLHLLGGQTELTGPPVHARVLLLSAENIE